MSGSNSAERKRHEPLVLVETADLSEEDWLDYRRRGIGGSDVSAIFGTSPFRTARDLYYDKLNIASVEDDEGNWVAMEMGHLLEPLVAKIFERKTGYRVYQIKKMFQHPQYPWMLADVDYFVELPDGTTAILEIKTTNYNARDNWWMNGKETVPVYEPFRSYAAGEKENIDGTRWRLLSIPEQSRPKLEFHSRKNLKAVVENPILRHKLGKFLDQHFNWYNYERIVLTDDYLPYSFFFEGYMVQGTKTCGGVILHGEEDIQTAKYGIHT